MKYLLIIALAAALLMSGCTGFGASASPAAPPAGNDLPPAPPTDVPPAPGSNAAPTTPQGEGNSAITASQLANHNKETDCWFAYKGKVYDSTQLIPSHKDYKQLLVPLCGTSSQFESAFEGKHGLSKVQVLIEKSALVGAYAG